LIFANKKDVSKFILLFSADIEDLSIEKMNKFSNIVITGIDKELYSSEIELISSD